MPYKIHCQDGPSFEVVTAVEALKKVKALTAVGRQLSIEDEDGDVLDLAMLEALARRDGARIP